MPHCSSSDCEIDIIDIAPVLLLPQYLDIICGYLKDCSGQLGNIMLNNLVLDRQEGYYDINNYDRLGKALFVLTL